MIDFILLIKKFNFDYKPRFDDADKNGPSKVSKYLQQVKRRSSSILKDENEPSNVKLFTKDYIVCNDDNDQAETYENLKYIIATIIKFTTTETKLICTLIWLPNDILDTRHRLTKGWLLCRTNFRTLIFFPRF